MRPMPVLISDVLHFWQAFLSVSYPNFFVEKDVRLAPRSASLMGWICDSSSERAVQSVNKKTCKVIANFEFDDMNFS